MVVEMDIFDLCLKYNFVQTGVTVPVVWIQGYYNRTLRSYCLKLQFFLLSYVKCRVVGITCQV